MVKNKIRSKLVDENNKVSLKNFIIVTFNVTLILVCIFLSFISYSIADVGFNEALDLKAASDLRSVNTMLNYKYKGEWNLRNGVLYKGNDCIENMTNELEDYKAMINGDVTIFKNDIRVATTFMNENGTRLTGTKANDKVIETVLKNGDIFIGKTEVLGKKMISAYMPLKDKNGENIGMLFTGVTYESMTKIENTYTRRISFLSFLLVGLVGIFSIVFMNRIMRPINTLRDNIEIISRGNISKNGTSFEESRITEFDAMIQNIIALKVKFRNTIEQIADSSHSLSAAAQELTAGAEQNSENISNIANSIVKVSENSSEQLNLIESNASDIKDIGEDIKKLNDDVSDINKIIAMVNVNIAKASEMINSTDNFVDDVCAKVHRDSDLVLGFENKIKDLSKWLRDLEFSVEKLNILTFSVNTEMLRDESLAKNKSLLALVESANTLSNEAKTACDNISTELVVVNNDMKTVLGNKKESMDYSLRSRKILEEFSDNFDKTKDNVDILLTMVNDSISSIKNINLKSTNIARNISRVEAVSTNVTNETQGISSIIEEQTTSVNEVKDASNSLALLAQTLQENIAAFKF